MNMDVKYLRANGLDLAYLEAGSGPLVLLLHGFPDTAYTWTELMPRLAEAGYRAVAPFLRGYFPSAIPEDGDYSVKTIGQDVLALMTALDASSAIVVGHDWGAFAAYTATNLAPQRVRKLVTLAIPHPRVIRPTLSTFWRAPHFLLFQGGPLSEWYVRRDDMAYIDYLYHYWSPDWQVPAPDLVQVKAGFNQPGRLQAALGYYRALFTDLLDLGKQRLYRQRIAVPTLAFAGRNDGALDVGLYAKAPTAFTGPYETLILEQAGHFLHREKPREFGDRLLQFIGPA